MADMSIQDKSKLAATLIEQAPPGQVNDVINDLRALIDDDQQLMEQARPALRAYNLSQLTVVEHAAAEGVASHSTILSESNILPGSEGEGERYVDSEGKRSYAFDHITLEISDYQPYELPEAEETFRAELAKSLAAYTKNHFPSGVSSVSSSQYPLLPPTPPAAPPAVAEPVEETAAPADSAGETTAPEAASEVAPVEQPVTDVVEEQLGEGTNEPEPTPAVGEGKHEEVDQPGGLEKLDEKVEEAKEEEEGVATEETPKADEPMVEEVQPAVEETAAVGDVNEAAVASAPVEERKQERVENPTYTLAIVGNRYNLSNFWTGRWRTQWVVDQAAGTVTGKIQVDVHYFEQGNVQLTTDHSASFPYPSESGSQSVASQIVTAIAKLETNYHLELNDVYEELGDKAFRALRRALPVTRQKMDWEKVGGYSLGADLTKARG